MAYPTTIPVRLFKQGEYAVINGEKYVPERTCQVIARHDGPHVYEHELSCGHSCEWVWDVPPAFCPACGSKVTE